MEKHSLFKAFGFAIRGLVVFLRDERNARIHLAATIIVILMGFYLKVSLIEWTVLFLAIGLVFALEAINTAIEYLVDLVSPEIQETAGKAKDVAAGAVLIAALCAAIVGLIIFGPKIMLLL